jgi:hypothetical protein
MSNNPKNEEFIMVLRLTDKGNLRSNFKNNFKSILWKEKIKLSRHLLKDLRELCKVGCFHKDFS